MLAAPAAAGKAAGPMADEPAMALLAGSLWAEGFAARPEALATHAEHVFSHIVWSLQVYKCTEQDQSNELPLIAAEARAAYDAQAAAKESTASAESRPSAAQVSEPGITDAANISGSLDEQGEPLSAFAASNLADDVLTGKGDGLTYRWIGPEDMDKMAFPNIFLKLISSYFAGAYSQVND